MARRIVLLQNHGCVVGSAAELASSSDSAISEFIGEDGAEYLSRHASELDLEEPGR
jgi:hypothetical protein